MRIHHSQTHVGVWHYAAEFLPERWLTDEMSTDETENRNSNKSVPVAIFQPFRVIFTSIA
jgi:hypothetical protein